MPGEEVAEQLLGHLLQPEAIGEAAKIVGDLGVIGQQRQRRLVGAHRALEIADPLAGDGQEVPAKAVALVLLQGLDREVAAGPVVLRLQGRHRAVEQGLDAQGLQLGDRGAQLQERVARSRFPRRAGRQAQRSRRGRGAGLEGLRRALAQRVAAGHGRVSGG
jgi:hypothetical protein